MDKDKIIKQLNDFFPRKVTLSAKLYLIFNQDSALFGWFFFIFFGIFFGVTFSMFLDYIKWGDKGNISDAPGKIIKISLKEINNKKYYRIKYEFIVKNRKYTNNIYMSYLSFKLGDNIVIEYKKSNPHISRIKGLKGLEESNIIYMNVFFTLLLFIISFGSIIVSFSTGINKIYLLTFGKVTKAKVCSKKDGGERGLYKITISYKTEKKREHKKDDIYLYEYEMKELSEKDNIILYDEINPNNSLLFTHLPPSICFKEGVFYIKRIRDVILVLLLPFSAIIFNIFLFLSSSSIKSID